MMISTTTCLDISIATRSNIFCTTCRGPNNVLKLTMHLKLVINVHMLYNIVEETKSKCNKFIMMQYEVRVLGYLPINNLDYRWLRVIYSTKLDDDTNNTLFLYKFAIIFILKNFVLVFSIQPQWHFLVHNDVESIVFCVKTLLSQYYTRAMKCTPHVQYLG